MQGNWITCRQLGASALLTAALAGCATSPAPKTVAPAVGAQHAAALLDRVTWGVTPAAYAEMRSLGGRRYLDAQLHPGPDRLPAEIEAQIAAMTISRRPVEQLAAEMEERRRSADLIADDSAKKAAQQAYQQEMNRLAREAALRSLLRDVYSHNQLREQMTWFWLNHFSVHQGKHNLRLLVGDYEDRAIRPHALGKFRDLLRATAHHPAMLLYLDNQQNAVNHINENYARELMELHTLGVDGGYTQKDVQELARILTGMGVNHGTETPRVRPALQGQYVRQGLFEFNPNRHDYGDKVLLGQAMHGHGLAEIDEALDRLSRHPATAHFISRKLAIYFLGREPGRALLEQMAGTFTRSDGDIAAVLATLFGSDEFSQSLGQAFKDPMHYVVSAVRLAYDQKPILNAAPMINWLQRLGEPLYGRQTPDGYPLLPNAWTSPGQMMARFEVGKAIGAGSAGLFKPEGASAPERPAFPQLANALYYEVLQQKLAPPTRQALDQAASPQEWNAFLLASPEFMHR
jgi:uncharacterized protein (DUF1800 family)